MQLADFMEGSFGEPSPGRPYQHAIVPNLGLGALFPTNDILVPSAFFMVFFGLFKSGFQQLGSQFSRSAFAWQRTSYKR